MAIVPVHLFGQAADLDPLMSLANRHHLHIIEDYAQAIGAVFTDRKGSENKVGTVGTIGCTSFFPSKNLGCYGDGGAITTKDPLLAEKIRMIANHGQRVKYHHEEIGVNSRLDTIQAAILQVKLKYLKKYEKSRNAVADYYDEALKSVPFLQTPYRAPYSSHVFHQYTITLNGVSREAFKKHLEERSIPAMIYYPLPLHFQKAFRTEGINKGAFPVSESLSENVISLPIHTEMGVEQLSYICETIQAFKS